MSFTVLFQPGRQETHTGSDTYSVGAGGQLVIDSVGKRTIYAPMTWHSVVDSNPT